MKTSIKEYSKSKPRVKRSKQSFYFIDEVKLQDLKMVAELDIFSKSPDLLLPVFTNLMITTVVENTKHYFSLSLLFLSVMANTDEILFAPSNVPPSLVL